MTTKASFRADFKPGEGGKTAVSMARWINTRRKGAVVGDHRSGAAIGPSSNPLNTEPKLPPNL
jgi:hypothetical protein